MTASTRLVAVLVADAVGYSRLMEDDDRQTLTTLDACRAVFRDQVDGHEGRVVDMAGDSILAVFGSATAAIRAALEIQRLLQEKSGLHPEHRRMLFRIGINLGEILEKPDGTVYGDGVNVAARLQSLGMPGTVTISGAVYDQVKNRLTASIEYIGDQAVKNISEPVRAYRVADGHASSAKPPPREGTSRKKAAIVGLLVACLLVGAAGLWLSARGKSAHPGASVDPVFAMPTGPSIAVLPFVNMSSDPAQDYFSDGLTEDIITELSRFRGLYVLARNTTYQFKNKAVDVPAVGQKLGVQYILEGSVRRSADQVRITAQLIDVRSGSHTWAERYDRGLKDIFIVQEEISSKIAAAVSGGYGGSIQRTARDAAFAKSPEQLQAYDYLLRGTLTNEWWNPQGYRTAKEQIEKALQLDPSLAAARQQYAWLMLMGWIFRLEKSQVPPAEVKQNAIRAVELDPGDPLAHRTAAYGYYYDKQFELFEREVKAALDLAPNNPEVLSTLGFLIAIHGDWDRGVRLAIKANDLNPVSAGGWYNSARYYDYFHRGMYKDALAALKLHPAQGLVENQHKYVGVYAAMGDVAKAREHWDKCLELDPEWSPDKLYRLFHLWNFEESFIDQYMETIAKAGYRRTGQEKGVTAKPS